MNIVRTLGNFTELIVRGVWLLVSSKNYTEVTLTMLNKATTSEVTAESLLADRIIGKINDGIVVLATGKLDKKLTVKAKRFTKVAAEKIEAAGGKIEVI